MGMTECKRKLYIITQEYPYNYAEKTFLEPELKRLQSIERFDITIISVAARGSDLTSNVDSAIKVVNIPLTSIFKDFRKFCLGIKYGIHYFWDKGISNERSELKKGGFTLGKLFDSVMFYIQANMFYHDMLQMNFDMNHAIVYTYWFHTQTLAFALHKNELENIKLISRIHRADLYDDSFSHGRQPFRLVIDSKMDCLFFIAKAGLKYYVDRIGGVFNEKYILSRLGVECSETYTQIQERKKENAIFLLVSCSSLIPRKRVEIIVQALSMIDEIHIRWIHFGDGCERKNIEERAFELLGNKENIEYYFRGQTNSETILSFYREHLVGCFITTSQSEGCPVSIQEALACGLPIIATEVGEVPYMIEENGILLPENPHPEEVANAIRKIEGASVEESNKMRKESRDLWKKNFDAEKNYSFFIDKLVKL